VGAIPLKKCSAIGSAASKGRSIFETQISNLKFSWCHPSHPGCTLAGHPLRRDLPGPLAPEHKLGGPFNPPPLSLAFARRNKAQVSCKKIRSSTEPELPRTKPESRHRRRRPQSLQREKIPIWIGDLFSLHTSRRHHGLPAKKKKAVVEKFKRMIRDVISPPRSNLPIVQVVRARLGKEWQVIWTTASAIIRQPEISLNGLPTPDAKKKIHTAWLEIQNSAQSSTTTNSATGSSAASGIG